MRQGQTTTPGIPCRTLLQSPECGRMIITECTLHYFTDEILFVSLVKFRYTDSEIESKVEELRNILSEQAGIASKDNKEGKSTYVQLVF